MSKNGTRLSRLGVLAPAALSACIDASVLAAPAAGAILSTVLKELSKAFMLKKWFHGVMSAEQAELLLMQKGKNGSYLVRESQTHTGEYVLSVRVRGRVSHVMIRREHNQYDVGIGENFDDLTGLIEHCRAYPLIETSGDVLRLMQPVNIYGATPQNIPRTPAMDYAEFMGVGEENAVGGQVEEEEEEVLEVGNGFYGNFVDGGFDAEYKSLSQAEETSTYTMIEGRRRENRYKNRYRNVLPYDQTRVILPRDPFTPEEDFNDYINASYIKPLRLLDPVKDRASATAPHASRRTAFSVNMLGSEPMENTPLVTNSFQDEALRDTMKKLRIDIPENFTPPGVVRDKFYIAAQGCLWSSVQAFWQMIVHNDVRVIAMVTNRVEGGKRKCERYWPLHGERERYGDIQISTLREHVSQYYVVREFQVTTVEKKRTIVYQYQYKHWADHGVPTETKGILTYQEEINKRMLQISNSETAPDHNILCVHCSAGIGRSGAFIALDMLIDKVKTYGPETHIDIHATVKLCRTQRAGMVQNRMQYKFLYEAVQHYLDAVNADAYRGRSYGTVEPYFSV